MFSYLYAGFLVASLLLVLIRLVSKPEARGDLVAWAVVLTDVALLSIVRRP